MVMRWCLAGLLGLLLGVAAAQDPEEGEETQESSEGNTFAAPAPKSAEKIDKHTALILSDKAPLASLGGDHKAIWVHAPSSTDRSVLVYFHGYDAYVTASATKPDGDFPAWRPARISGDDEREWNTAKEHKLRSQTQTASGYKPIVMVPEVGIPNPTPPPTKTCKASQKAPCLDGAWALTSNGTIATTLNKMIPDAASEAGKVGIETALSNSSGYSHIFLVAHSGGGSIATAATLNTLPRSTATDVWLLDATYTYENSGGGVYQALALAWQGAGLIGPTAGDSPSRLVVVWLAGTSTAAAANKIYDSLGSWASMRQKVTYGTADMTSALNTKNFVFIEVPAGKIAHGEMPETLINVLMLTATRTSPSSTSAPAYEGGTEQGGTEQGGTEQGGTEQGSEEQSDE